MADITLTFIGSRHPRELLKYLKTVRGYKVTKTSSGIYQVSGDYVPIQIIESKKLSESDNLWLKSLTDDLEIRNADAILKEKKLREKAAEFGAYLDILLRANPNVFMEVCNMANGTMTFEEVFTEAGIIPEWIERGRQEGINLGIERGINLGIEQTARNLLVMGMSLEEIARATKLSVEKIRLLALG